MASKQEFLDFSSWRVDDCTIKAHSVYTVDFFDTTPNQFIIQNANDEKLLVGISQIPTDTNYEYEVSKNTVKPLGRPIRTNKLYIYNTGSTDVVVKIFSVYLPFDMATLANTAVTIENAEIKTDGIINGFKTGVSLPSGDNTIGKIEAGADLKTVLDWIKSFCDSMNTLLMTIESYLPSDTNKGIIKDISTQLSTISNTMTNSNLTVKEIVNPVKVTNLGLKKVAEYSKIDMAGTTTIDFTTEPFNPDIIVHLVNDGANDFTVKCGYYENDNIVWGGAITLKKGEVLSDETIQKFDAIQISPVVPTGESSSPAISWRLVVGLC